MVWNVEKLLMSVLPKPTDVIRMRPQAMKTSSAVRDAAPPHRATQVHTPAAAQRTRAERKHTRMNSDDSRQRSLWQTTQV